MEIFVGTLLHSPLSSLISSGLRFLSAMRAMMKRGASFSFMRVNAGALLKITRQIRISA